MFMGPFMVLVGDEPVWFDHASDAAQRWADEEDARVFDARNVEIPDDCLWDLLR